MRAGEAVYSAFSVEADEVSLSFPSSRGGFFSASGELARRGRAQSKDVLRAVSVSVAPGELVGIIGPNGAGKSSLLRVLSGAERPRGGVARLLGRNMAELSPREIARRLAFVSQTSDVAFGFRVDQVVMMGRSPHLGGLQLSGPNDQETVREALEKAGILDLAGRSVAELSGGEQRLVALARALAQRPEVLLLDEPSAHLDPRHAIRILELVASEVQSRRIACVLVAHDLNLAAAFVDRVVLLEDGEVRAIGSVDEVMTQENLARAFGVELCVEKTAQGRAFVPRRRRQLGLP
jgi:iron complex transport system ATP-binding protein